MALGLKTLATNDYKGVVYARISGRDKGLRERLAVRVLEAYSSSYLHFAPGLSDDAASICRPMPANAYLGLYIDGDGPIGIMRDVTDKETAYFHYLPMVTLTCQVGAEDLHRPVWRRHLDQGRAALWR